MLGTVETVYKPLAPVEQNDLEFVIPGESDTLIYIKNSTFALYWSRAQEKMWI